MGAKVFPVSGADAARLILTVDPHDGADAAMKFTGAVMTAVWAQERDIANAATRAELLAQCGLSAQRLEQALAPSVQAAFGHVTQQATDAQVLVRPAEQLRVTVASDISRALADGPQSGGAGSRALGAAVIALVAQRDALRRDMLARVAEASRILLYNARTRLQFRALAAATLGGPAIGGAEAIGLGRSIYGVLDRRLVAHALEAV